MNTRYVLGLILLHCAFFICGTVFFIILFHTPLLIKSLFFYRGIWLLCIATLLMLISHLLFRKLGYIHFFTIRDVVLSIVFFFCINLVFFTHLPVTADRSISVFILAYMNNHNDQSLTKNTITNVFINKYITNNDGIQKRFDEQITSGNIKKNQDNYHITEQGKLVILFYKFISDIFVIDKKNFSP